MNKFITFAQSKKVGAHFYDALPLILLALPIVPFFLRLGLPVFSLKPALLLPFHLLNFLSLGIFVQNKRNLPFDVNHSCVAILICVAFL